MGHNLTFNSLTGEWEFMSVGAAWHQLGQVVDACLTWEETIIKAGLDWTVSKRQLEFAGLNVPAWGLFRDDQVEVDKAFLCPTTETYQAIQNRFMFTFLDAMIEDEGGAHYEAAGSLNGGNQVFALVNIGKAFEIGAGDRFESYLLFADDRTGKRAAKCFLTTVRVVCANTLEQALQGVNADQSVSFNHRRNIQERMVESIGLFTGARMDVELLEKKLTYMSDRLVTTEILTRIFDRLFPKADEKDSARRDNKLIDILRLFEDNDGNAFPQVRGTAYNLLNAITQYMDHFTPVRRTANKLGMTDDQIRSELALVGPNAMFKTRAMDIILEETASAPIL